MTGLPVSVGELVGTDYLNEVARGHWRKTTVKDVSNTVTETDLLNGEFTVGGNALSTNRAVRLTAWGDWLNTSGSIAAAPRIKLKLGATPTIVIDTGAVSAVSASSATRMGWRIVAEILNLGVANSQLVTYHCLFGCNGTAAENLFATGEGTLGAVTAGATGPGLLFGVAYNTAAIDTTAAMAVILTTTNPTATTYDMKLVGALMEII